MAELRGGRDETDGNDLPVRRYPADADDGAHEIQSRAEPSPRAEYAALSRRNADRANAGQGRAYQAEADQPDKNQVQAGHSDGEQGNVDPAAANQAYTGTIDADQADTAQDHAKQADADQATEPSDGGVLERFEPSRAGLPEVSYEGAAAYIETHLADRPWLAAIRTCSRDVQRVFVALDQGHGHAHIRHDSWVTEEMNERRVRNLEDPAQLNQSKREARIDAFKAGDQPHRCGDIATRITNPEAFATAFARGVEHPEVRAALDSPVPVPRPVTLPISEVLGEDGHKVCSGWQLEPVNGSMLEAVANREAWIAGDRDVPEPRTHPVGTFEGGTVTYVFRPGAAGGHEVITMYVNPPDEQTT
jgi:hypothetical protein